MNKKQQNYNLSKQTACKDCEKFYKGQTRRHFEKLFKEHLPRAIKIPKSNFAYHLVNNNHSYSNLETNLKLLHICRKGHKYQL